MPKIYLRPYAPSSPYQFSVSGASQNWQAIDEASPFNGNTDYCFLRDDAGTVIVIAADSHLIKSAAAFPTGRVNYTKLRYAVRRETTSAGAVHSINVGIQYGGSWIDVAREPTAYTLYENQFNTIPAGLTNSGKVWKWSDLSLCKAFYQGQVKKGASAAEIRITGWELEVDFDYGAEPSPVDVSVDIPEPSIVPITLSSICPVAESAEPDLSVEDATEEFLASLSTMEVAKREPSFSVSSPVGFSVVSREPSFSVEVCSV